MKEILSECFGWNNWPPRSFDNKVLHPSAGADQEDRQLVPVDNTKIPLLNSRLDQISDSSHGLFDRNNHDIIVDLISNTVDDHSAHVPFRWRIPFPLDVEAVCLKREEETVALHKKFSNRADEGTAIISQRIHNVRRSAIRVRTPSSRCKSKMSTN